MPLPCQNEQTSSVLQGTDGHSPSCVTSVRAGRTGPANALLSSRSRVRVAPRALSQDPGQARPGLLAGFLRMLDCGWVPAEVPAAGDGARMPRSCGTESRWRSGRRSTVRVFQKITKWPPYALTPRPSTIRSYTALADVTDTALDAVRRQPATPVTALDQDRLTNRCTSGHNLPGVGSER